MSRPSNQMEEQLKKDVQQKAVSREAGDTRAVMALNLQALGERGEKLGELQARSTQQTAQAQEVAQNARALSSKLEEESAALDQVVDTLTAGPVRRAAADAVVGAVRMFSPGRRAVPDSEKSADATSAVPAGDVAENIKEPDKKENKQNKKDKQRGAATNDQAEEKKPKKEKKEKKAKHRDAEAVASPSDSERSGTELPPSSKDKKEKKKHKKKDKKEKREKNDKAKSTVLSDGESASVSADSKSKQLSVKERVIQGLNAISPRKKAKDGATKEPASDDDVSAKTNKPKLQRTDTDFAATQSVKALNLQAQQLEARAATAFSKGGSGKNLMGGSPRTGSPRTVSFDGSAKPAAPSPRAKGSTTGARIAGRHSAPEGQLSSLAGATPPAKPSVADFQSAYDLSRPPPLPSGYNDTPPLSFAPSASSVASSFSSSTAATTTTPRQQTRVDNPLQSSVAAATSHSPLAQPAVPPSGNGPDATASTQSPKTKPVVPKVNPPKQSYWNIIAGIVIGIFALGAFAAGFALTYTGLLTPLGIAMTYGGIWLASSAAGLAGFALTIAAGLIVKEVVHLAYDYFFVDEEDKIFISAPITNPAMTKLLHGQDNNKKAAKGSDETFCYGFFNWLWRNKTKEPATIPEDQQKLIKAEDHTQTQSLC